MIKVRVDRFEGDIAVCITEDERILDIRREEFPLDIKEGDILELTLEGGKPVSAVRLTDEMEEKKKLAEYLWNKLKKRNGKH